VFPFTARELTAGPFVEKQLVGMFSATLTPPL